MTTVVLMICSALAGAALTVSLQYSAVHAVHPIVPCLIMAATGALVAIAFRIPTY